MFLPQFRKLLSLVLAIFAGGVVAGCLGIGRESREVNAAVPDAFMIHNGDKVVFYGDSITDDQWYPTFIRAFIATRHPEWRNTFLNRGVSGDRTSSIKRFERDCVDQKPDVALFMMGYNDMRYGKLSSKWLETFLGNVEESVCMLRAKSPKTKLLLISSPLNETVVSHEPCWVSPKSYPYTLLMLSGEEKKLARKLKVPFLDMGTRYGSLVGLGEVVGQETFALSRDGVHPQKEGQLFLAAFMLEKMHANGDMASTLLESIEATVKKSEKCEVRAVNWSCEGEFVFERRCESLPFPIPATSATFAFLAEVNDTLNRDILRVINLDSKAFELIIDGHSVALFREDELAAGINLSKYDTPMRRQALKVLAAARKVDELKNEIFLLIRQNKLDGFGRVTKDTPPELKVKLPVMNKAIETAKRALYALNKPLWHKFMLRPSKKVPKRFSHIIDNDLNQSHLRFDMTPLRVNGNNGKIIKGAFALTISNPNTTRKNGTVEWKHCPNWSVLPEIAKFAVPADGKIVLKFKAKCTGKMNVSSTPEARIRWHWSKNWHYPRIETVALPVIPLLTIPRRRSTITIDGDLSDWSSEDGVIVLNRIGQFDNAVPGKRKLWDGPEDLSAKFRLDWDEKNLYIALAVKDSCHLQRKKGTNIWSDDCVFLSFQMDDKSPRKGVYEFGLALGDDENIFVKYKDSAKDAVGSDIRYATRLTRKGEGVNYEVGIPWSRLAPFKAKPGESFRFTVTVNDADDIPGKGFNYIEWTPGVNYGKNPKTFGVVTLGGK